VVAIDYLRALHYPLSKLTNAPYTISIPTCIQPGIENDKNALHK